MQGERCDLSHGEVHLSALAVGRYPDATVARYGALTCDTRIVRIEDAHRGIELFKQAQFGLAITRHRAVVIQMITGQVGEHRHINMQTPKPPLI